MKHISQLVEVKPKPSTTRSKKLPMDPRWIAAIFGKLQARYGHKWTSSYPTPELVKLAATEWGEQLAELTAEEVGAGLDKWDQDWPPSAPEFKKTCKREPVKALHRIYTALPRPAPDPATGIENIKAARAKLQAQRGEK